MPKGLYFVDRSARISTGDLVAFAPSDEVRHWLNDEGIVGADWPLLKHVAGLSGDEIALRIGRPVNTVWTRLHHARKEFTRIGRRLGYLEMEEQ